MTKLFKKLSAIALTAAMATTMALTASAESTTKEGSLYGDKTLAILSAHDTSVEGFTMPWEYTAATFYWGTGTVYAALDVDDYYTGALLDRRSRTGADTYPGGVIGMAIGSSVSQSHVTLYSAHEVHSGSSGVWGAYRQLIDV